jgi:hypothetical protein
MFLITSSGIVIFGGGEIERERERERGENAIHCSI